MPLTAKGRKILANMKRQYTEDSRKRMGWRKGKIYTAYEKSCEVCGTIFRTVPTSSKQKCCSRKCSDFLRKKERIVYKCAYCGVDMSVIKTSGRKYCSTGCKIAALAQQRKNRYKNKRLYGKWRDSKELKQWLIERHGKCQSCGWDKEINVLEMHHIDRNRRNNTEENVRLLCPNCHSIDHYAFKDGQFKNNLGVKSHAFNTKGQEVAS